MKVNIKDDLYAESDSYQFILREYTGKHDKKGNPTYKDISFHGRLSSLFSKVLEMEIKESKAETVEELVSEIKNQNEKLEELFEGVK